MYDFSPSQITPTRLAASVHGGAGGSRIAVSKYSSLGSSTSSLQNALSISNSNIITNEKQVMQELNERLYDYLSKVSRLKKSNRELEVKIREFLDSKKIRVSDWKVHEKALKQLRAELQKKLLANAKVQQQIDNARLSAEDFRMKYQNEESIKKGVEMDITELQERTTQNGISRQHLESEAENLKNKLTIMQKDHEETVSILIQQYNSSGVTVEVDAYNEQDLTSELIKIKEEFEAILKKLQNEPEIEYQKEFDLLIDEKEKIEEKVKEARLTLKSHEDNIQMLKISLQQHLTEKTVFDAKLKDTKASYAMHLHENKIKIEAIMEEIHQLTSAINKYRINNNDFISTKTKLETEIAMYKDLLAGEDKDRSKGIVSGNIGLRSYEETIEDRTESRTVSSVVEDS